MVRDALVVIYDLFMNGFKASQPDDCSTEENNSYSTSCFEQHPAPRRCEGMLKTQKIESGCFMKGKEGRRTALF